MSGLVEVLICGQCGYAYVDKEVAEREIKNRNDRIVLLEQALRIIAGREQCANNLMSNVDVAIWVLDRKTGD